MTIVHTVDRVLGLIERLFLVLANLCLIAMLLANMSQIASRAIWDKGIALVFPWTVFLFCWMCFFGFFVVYRQSADITVGFIIDRLGEVGRRASRIGVNLIILLLMGIMLWHAPQTLRLQLGDIIELVELERWIQTFPLFISCALIFIDACIDLALASAGAPPRKRQTAHL